MELSVADLGLTEFIQAWECQKNIFRKIKDGSTLPTLILCRHYPVITLGRRSFRQNILADSAELARRGIQVYETGRGGDVTYHGPGQIIAYPIFDLSHIGKDIHSFLRKLEDVIIMSLCGFGVKAVRKEGFTGAWVGTKKIASIGISVKNWISLHGLALNIKSNDLDNFKLIRPCGMQIRMTCAEEASGSDIEIGQIKKEIIRSFQAVFN